MDDVLWQFVAEMIALRNKSLGSDSNDAGEADKQQPSRPAHIPDHLWVEMNRCVFEAQYIAWLASSHVANNEAHVVRALLLALDERNMWRAHAMSMLGTLAIDNPDCRCRLATLGFTTSLHDAFSCYLNQSKQEEEEMDPEYISNALWAGHLCAAPRRASLTILATDVIAILSKVLSAHLSKDEETNSFPVFTYCQISATMDPLKKGKSF